MRPARFMRPQTPVKKLLWLVAMCVFLASVIGATVVARPVEHATAPTPFDSFGTVILYSL